MEKIKICNGINNIQIQQINKKFGSNYKDMLSKARIKEV